MRTRLYSPTVVAHDAGISRQTLYVWGGAGILGELEFDVDGSPVFTASERDMVVDLAKARRELRAELGLKKP